MSEKPHCAMTSASPIFASVSPTAPAASCRWAISTHLWVFPWGRNLTPAWRAKAAQRAMLASSRSRSTIKDGVSSASTWSGVRTSCCGSRMRDTGFPPPANAWQSVAGFARDALNPTRRRPRSPQTRLRRSARYNRRGAGEHGAGSTFPMTAEQAGAAAERRRPLQASWGRVTRAFASYEGAIFVALILLATVVSTIAPRFLQPDNLFEVARNFSFIAAVGVGEAIVILSGGGGIDLSVGSLMGLGGVVTTKLLGLGAEVTPAIAAGIAAGWACGAVNGILVTKARMTPLIPTLGMLSIAHGLSLVIT